MGGDDSGEHTVELVRRVPVKLVSTAEHRGYHVSWPSRMDAVKAFEALEVD